MKCFSIRRARVHLLVSSLQVASGMKGEACEAVLCSDLVEAAIDGPAAPSLGCWVARICTFSSSGDVAEKPLRTWKCQTNIQIKVRAVAIENENAPKRRGAKHDTLQQNNPFLTAHSARTPLYKICFPPSKQRFDKPLRGVCTHCRSMFDMLSNNHSCSYPYLVPQLFIRVTLGADQFIAHVVPMASGRRYSHNQP